MLLVGPGGQNLIILSDVIGGTDWVNINYTLDDAAAAAVPASGTPGVRHFQANELRHWRRVPGAGAGWSLCEPDYRGYRDLCQRL